jgi:UPF0716 protein FxsA
MLFAVALFICWLFAEVYVAIRIAEAIGVLAMLLLLIASWPVGTWALRTQGRAAWRRLMDRLAVNRPPGREVLDGALVMSGGALMLVPGFISDLFGALLLLPPTRWIVRRLLVRNLQSKLVLRFARMARRPYDVDSTATDIPPPRIRP